VSSSSPIPPLPFYYDFDTGDAGMNAYLFAEDLKRMEKLHVWVKQGAKPIRVPATARHMVLHKLPPQPHDAAAAAAASATTATNTQQQPTGTL
jgi:hypothetical protein